MNSEREFSPELIAAARRVVTEQGGQRQTSVSLLQRRLKLGYGAAKRLIARLEADSVVTAPDWSGRRWIVTTTPVEGGDPEFKRRALQKFAGCDSGDPGEPGRPSIWLFGGGQGQFAPEREDEDETDAFDEVASDGHSADARKSFRLNRGLLKFLAVLHGYPLGEWLAFARERRPCGEGSRGFFSGGLYPPRADPNPGSWEIDGLQQTGFATEEEYLAWHYSHRLPAIRSWADEHRPDLVICSGRLWCHQFKHVFLPGVAAPLIRHDYGSLPRGSVFHQALDGRMVVVLTRGFGDGRNHQELQYLGGYVARLRKNGVRGLVS